MSDKTETPAVPYQDRTHEEMQALEQTFRRGGANYVAEPAPGHDVHGLWHCFGAHQRTGYAAHAVALHWLLSKTLGITTELVPHRHVDIDIERFPKDRYDMLFGWMKSAVGHPHALFASYPPEVAMHMKDVAPNVVPYCAFEGTSVSEFCRDLCNSAQFREIWVVSDNVRNAMVAGGVDGARVRTVRPPICDGPWQMPELTPRTEGPFTFGTLGTWQKRKGMHDLVRAYFGAFKRSEDVQLTIRTSSFSGKQTIREFKETLTAEIAEIAREFGDDNFPASKAMPRLRLLLGTDLTDQEVVEWISSLDCYVNPSYGEGLGIPHTWAKASGVPMVSTGYGAVGDLLNEIAAEGESLDTIVPHELTQVDPEILRIALMFDANSQWGGYKVEDFRAALREQFEAGARRDAHSASYVREAFSLQACAPAVRAGLAEIIGEERAAEWDLR